MKGAVGLAITVWDDTAIWVEASVVVDNFVLDIVACKYDLSIYVESFVEIEESAVFGVAIGVEGAFRVDTDRGVKGAVGLAITIWDDTAILDEASFAVDNFVLDIVAFK